VGILQRLRDLRGMGGWGVGVTMSLPFSNKLSFSG